MIHPRCAENEREMPPQTEDWQSSAGAREDKSWVTTRERKRTGGPRQVALCLASCLMGCWLAAERPCRRTAAGPPGAEDPRGGVGAPPTVVRTVGPGRGGGPRLRIRDHLAGRDLPRGPREGLAGAQRAHGFRSYFTESGIGHSPAEGSRHGNGGSPHRLRRGERVAAVSSLRSTPREPDRVPAGPDRRGVSERGAGNRARFVLAIPPEEHGVVIETRARIGPCIPCSYPQREHGIKSAIDRIYQRCKF